MSCDNLHCGFCDVAPSKQKYFIGDRVTRELYMEDGTWEREGDDCLSKSPRIIGTVISALPYDNEYTYGVKWDSIDIPRHGYLEHGLTRR